jgi:Transposase, Mutator family
VRAAAWSTYTRWSRPASTATGTARSLSSRGLHVTSAEDGPGWLAFLRDLVARGLTGVRLVTSDAHAGLTAAIGVLPGASW